MKHIKKINEFVTNLNIQDLISNLNKETIIISSSSDIKRNDNYKKILSMGNSVLPNLLENLKTDNNIGICMLISDISGIDSPEEIKGNIDKLKEFYLNEFDK